MILTLIYKTSGTPPCFWKKPWLLGWPILGRNRMRLTVQTCKRLDKRWRCSNYKDDGRWWRVYLHRLCTMDFSSVPQSSSAPVPRPRAMGRIGQTSQRSHWSHWSQWSCWIFNGKSWIWMIDDDSKCNTSKNWRGFVMVEPMSWLFI